MPRVEVEFDPAAAEEVDAAVSWYREQSESAASAFVTELDRAIVRIGDAPVGPSAITIFAVAHARRLPGYWERR